MPTSKTRLVGRFLLALLAAPAAALAQAPSAPAHPAPVRAPALASPGGLSCPGDKVVWVNTRSGIYHFQGERYFGKTKSGKYACEKDADREGDRPTHNGQ